MLWLLIKKWVKYRNLLLKVLFVEKAFAGTVFAASIISLHVMTESPITLPTYLKRFQNYM